MLVALRRWGKRRSGTTRRSRARDKLRNTLPGWPETVHASIAHFTAAGPGFEHKPARALDPAATRARLIAFYLPQFHAFEENNRWWGDGFTEWRNVARAVPRFQGHFQPRIPRDLGHVDLDNAATLHAQAALARSAGIDAFCFYYYWFDGKRLMERPLDRFLRENVAQDFCLMWANENWTRRWDGRDQDVLIQQHYAPADDLPFVEDTARYMAHPRYVRVNDRPLFIIYCAQHIPEAARRIAAWRTAWTERLGIEPLLLMAQTYDTTDPRPFGLDAAVEFPPHKLTRDIGNRRSDQVLLDPDFTGQVRPYVDVVHKARRAPTPAWPLVRTVFPHWDNEARRPGRGVVMHGSLPARFERWSSATVNRAIEEPLHGEALVFVNAWNEWAEGAHLEPDVYYGHAMLNALRRSLADPALTPRASGLLLVGHDAHANGAQLLLLAIARELSTREDLDVTVLLLGGGALLEQYQALCPVHILDPQRDTAALEQFLERQACSMVLCNTVVCGQVAGPLQATGARMVSLVHEMPSYMRKQGLQRPASQLAAHSDVMVFASQKVRDGLHELCGDFAATEHLLPQGLYHVPVEDAAAATRLREAHGIDTGATLVISLGFADHRKGFDRFAEAARASRQSNPDLRFAWIGKRCGDARAWLQKNIEQQGPLEELLLVDFVEDVSVWLSAADLYYLSSREDPYPTSALEAFYLGLPLVAHRGCTGMDAIFEQHGMLVANTADAGEVLAGIAHALQQDNPASATLRREHVARHHDFRRYVTGLLGLLDPAREQAAAVAPDGP